MLHSFDDSSALSVALFEFRVSSSETEAECSFDLQVTLSVPRF